MQSTKYTGGKSTHTHNISKAVKPVSRKVEAGGSEVIRIIKKMEDQLFFFFRFVAIKYAIK